MVGESISSFTTEYHVSGGFFIDALYQIEDISFYFQFVGVFIMKWYWICQMVFLYLLNWLCGFFPLLIRFITLLNFQIFNQPCIHVMHPTCSWYVILLHGAGLYFIYWYILLRTFVFLYIRNTGLFLFLWCVCLILESG